MTLGQLIEQITSRPHMWVNGASFDAAAAFISGYDWAVQSYSGLGRAETELGRFRSWLAEKAWEKYGYSTNLGWESYIVREATDDGTKFSLLRDLYGKFLLEQ